MAHLDNWAHSNASIYSGVTKPPGKTEIGTNTHLFLYLRLEVSGNSMAMFGHIVEEKILRSIAFSCHLVYAAFLYVSGRSNLTSPYETLVWTRLRIYS
jgi:hypothetical protein